MRAHGHGQGAPAGAVPVPSSGRRVADGNGRVARSTHLSDALQPRIRKPRPGVQATRQPGRPRTARVGRRYPGENPGKTRLPALGPSPSLPLRESTKGKPLLPDLREGPPRLLPPEPGPGGDVCPHQAVARVPRSLSAPPGDGVVRGTTHQAAAPGSQCGLSGLQCPPRPLRAPCGLDLGGTAESQVRGGVSHGQ